MKKNFFKKLSFVMALAMLISVIAPAAGALAAASPALNAPKKTLHLSRDNEFDFNIKNKVSGSTYVWSSADENVVTVDAKNGVAVATGVGSTKVSVVITFKDKTTKTLSANVTVRDNIADIKSIYVQTPANADLAKLATGTDYDFGRTIETESGGKVTSSITRWFVDSNKATINDAGVFNATEAGTYKITAVAFQSKAKYEAWAALKDTTSQLNVLTSKTLEVTVVAAIDSVNQVDLDTAKVTFDSAVADAASKLTVYKLVGSTKVKQLVKEIKAVDAKNVAFTVDLYVPFDQETTYVFEYPGMEIGSFKAAKVAEDQVVKMVLSTSQVVAGATPKNLLDDVKLFNANDVDITTPTLKLRVTFAATGKVILSGNSVYMYTVNDTGNVKATYHTYKYDNQGQEIGNVVAEANLICVAAPTVAVSALNSWTITTGTPDFSNTNQIIAVGESGRLYVQVNQTNSDTKLNSRDNAGFSFTSSDQSFLIVDASGNLFPVKAGSVVVVVKYNDTVIDAINVTVRAQKVATSVKIFDGSVETGGFVLSTGSVDNSKALTVKVYDQYGGEFGTASATANLVNTNLSSSFASASGASVTFTTASGTLEGTYTYKISTNGMDRYVNVTVRRPDTAATSFRINLSATSFDLAVKAGDTSRTLTAALWGYAQNGVAVNAATLSASATASAANQYRIAIDCPDGTDHDVAANTTAYVLASATSGSAVVKKPAGTYSVVAYKSVEVSTGVYTWIEIDRTTFNVSNTQTAPVLASVKTLAFDGTVGAVATTDAGLRAVAFECFKITLGGNEIVASQIISVNAIGTTTSLYVSSVVVRQYIDGSWIDHTVNVGLNINKK